MKFAIVAAAVVALVSLGASGAAQAQTESPTEGVETPQWTVFSDQFGTRVDIPENIFSVDAGPPVRGRGLHLRSPDERARLMIYVEENDARHSPATFVQANLRASRETLDYDRVTNRFFAISGVKDGEIYYSRCNFPQGVAGPLHCVYVAYPKAEERLWDGIVTRISRSLRPVG
jgi:hypothetical protein